MHGMVFIVVSKIATPRAIGYWSSHARRQTDSRVGSWALSYVDLVRDIDAGFGKTDGGYDPSTTAASKALPCEFAYIGPADGIGASEAPRERSIVGMRTVSGTRVVFGSVFGWKETRAHPGQGVEENMAALGSG